MSGDWIASRFRPSPALELKRIDELPSHEQAALAELQLDSDFYGVLVPRVRGAASLKSVGRAAAELLLPVTTPATLDAARFADDGWRNDVIDLVLDGILEVEHDERFVSGADAFAFMECGGVAAAFERGGKAAGLHIDALRHAEALATGDAALLTSALYSYNRLPRTRTWATRFPNREAVLAHLGDHALLARHWIPPAATSGWISWQTRAPRASAPNAVTWKLYVSPRPEHIRQAFHALVRVLANVDGAQMKIGPDAAGLLRPDKLVAYFHTRAELDDAARALAAELRGLPAHGVPFTARIDEDALLSWGADPPDSERALSWLERESWRLFVARTLAQAMAVAKQATAPAIAPWRFAVERAHRHGIDVATWAPSPKLWSRAA